MSSGVRLLPVLIGTAGVLLTLRFAALAASSEPQEPNEHAPAAASADTAHAPETQAAPAEDHATPAHEQAAETKVASAEEHAAPAEPAAPAAAISQAQTKGEAEVLQNLSARRSALDERERDLTMREQLIGVTEKRVEEKLVELKALEEQLNVMLAKRNEVEEAQIGALVKTYENMKPADAARIFNKLDRQVLLTVASRMKPAKIGAVLAAMEPSKAQDLTVMMALRLNVARPKPAAEPQPVAQPLPPAPAAEAPNG